MKDTISVLLIADDQDEYIFIGDLLSNVPVQRRQLDWRADRRSAFEALSIELYDICLLDCPLGPESRVEVLKAIVGAFPAFQ